ncbi:DNA-binding domain-containing protein [Pendulispora brunnea]|uniref:DNA-binding domain-containing protein n=1 Tax=Pendulispora brunnea TaxID=2905690 RepID=A0ABZ2K5S4_9BACT
MTPTHGAHRGLADLQAFLAQAATSARPIPDDPALAAEAELVATGNARLSPAQQVDIYREQFWFRHLASLEEDYPTLQHLLGNDGFQALCRRYLDAHPPDSFSLRDLAAKMPDFLAHTDPYRADALLADCARLEWAFIEAFDAADAPPFDASVLATTEEEAWERAVIVFHPSLRFLALSHPVHGFRAAIRRGETPERPGPEPTHCIVYRANDIVGVEVVEPMAFALLERLARGMPLGPAGEEVAAMDASVEASIGAWFQAWVALGWLREVRV